MSVQISALGDNPLVFPDDVVESTRLQQQKQAKAGYDAAVAAQAKIIPANPNAPIGPLPPPTYSAPSVAPAVPEALPYKLHETDLVLPASERRKGLPWGTIGIVAGVVGVVGIVGWMMFKPTRGFKTAAAVAGLHGRRRRRRHRR
jgi:hypothetical protein